MIVSICRQTRQTEQIQHVMDRIKECGFLPPPEFGALNAP